MRETGTQPTARNENAVQTKGETMKITALYADVIMGINPGSLDNIGVSPIQSHQSNARFGQISSERTVFK